MTQRHLPHPSTVARQPRGSTHSQVFCQAMRSSKSLLAALIAMVVLVSGVGVGRGAYVIDDPIDIVDISYSHFITMDLATS